MEIHISHHCRVKYDLDRLSFSPVGKLTLENLRQIHELVYQINEKRDEIHQPGEFATAGEIYAMGLIDEIFHLIFATYRQDVDPALSSDCLGWLEQKLGSKKLTATLRDFTEEFLHPWVESKTATGESPPGAETDGLPETEIVLEELFFLSLANQNPAFSPARELFDDSHLQNSSDYQATLTEMELYFRSRPGLGSDRLNLSDFLRSPAKYSPDSLSGQLHYIAANWADLLRKAGFDLSRLLLGQDVLREGEKSRAAGPGPPEVITYFEEDEERFSRDSHWMPRLVMMAKNTLVWLNQLSKKYSRPITRLDQIPDIELDLLADRGFTGLWLIGLWERSPASRRIKQLCGNPEAGASAYSLKDYRPADSLGGDAALEELKERCRHRGIRLACDMVPNHTGLDSTWMLEHPEWFLSRPDCPYPTYKFSGENLSGSNEIIVRLEDHYFDRTDAAVVFKREDLRTGEVRYIYHGNDGTSMPWNDTAQLNYLNSDLRQAVMETILNIARRFPIIRFDAAMTLAKRHYRRLWFPEPGSGGDIPSRSDSGLSMAEFDRAFPNEFWREVADRVAIEVPDTLLLAEAFWMMEGYFVRTLGMHRVYNSAFMNMLKMEENGKFRKMLKNTLEFDPEILKRYVNFMSNPDEESAASQFGKGDKYFGVCVLLATLPGLPLFAHGQIEGFEEKYGMEYTRAYWQEQENEQLIKAHESVIFPLLHNRRIFAEVENFSLFDLSTAGGEVNENVIAYSNSWQDEKSLVVFNNGYDRADGWIKTSAAYLEKNIPEGPGLQQRDLSEILGLTSGENEFVILQDAVCGKEFLRRADEIIRKGLYLKFEGYEYHVFVNFRRVTDSSLRLYSALCQRLDGKGVSNIEDAVIDYLLLPLHNAFRNFFNYATLQNFIQDRSEIASGEKGDAPLSDLWGASREFLIQLEKFSGCDASETAFQHLQESFRIVKQLKELSLNSTISDRAAISALTGFVSRSGSKALIFSWICTKELPVFFKDRKEIPHDLSLLQVLRLGPVIEAPLREINLTDREIWRLGKLLPVMVSLQTPVEELTSGVNASFALFHSLFSKEEVRKLLGMNTFENVEYFNQETFEALAEVIYFLGFIRLLNGNPKITPELLRKFEDLHGQYLSWCDAGKATGYRTAQFLSKLKGNH